MIRKLGSGSYSTVWLVSSKRYDRNQLLYSKLSDMFHSVPAYVALKVMAAKASIATTEVAVSEHPSTECNDHPNSGHVTRFLDHLKHEGPNDIHQCLVFEVMGLTAASFVEDLPENKPIAPGKPPRYPRWMAKTLLLHTLRGIALVHKNGIVHGDLQPGNLLFSVKDFQMLQPQQLEQQTAGTARPLKRVDRKVHLWTQKYLYRAPSLYEHVQLGQDLCVKLSDFGAGKSSLFRSDMVLKISGSPYMPASIFCHKPA